MEKSNQHHHPKKGARIKVDPIRKVSDIRAISKMLSARNHLLFTMGVNNGLRAGDLLKLKAKDVRNMKAGDILTIRESKTGKENVLVINKTVYKSLKFYLEMVSPRDNDYLFESRKGKM